MPIQIIFIDIDDTLVGSNDRINPKVFEAIKSARDKNVILSVSTGRPALGETLDYYSRVVSEEAYHSFFNGGLIRNVSGNIIYKSMLQKYQFQELYKLARSLNCAFEYYTEDNIYMETENSTARLHQDIINYKASIVESFEFLSILPIKIQYVVRNEQVDEILSEILKLRISYGVGKNSKLNGISFISVLPRGNTKLSAAKKICDHYNVKLINAMMIGDSQGDLDLMSEVGFSVAVENATEAVKNAARYIVESANDGGVASAIRLALGVE